MKPSVGVFLDMRTKSKQHENKHPLKLRIGVDKDTSRPYSIGWYFSEKEYNNLLKNKRKDPYKDIWNLIEAKMERAEKIIDEMMPFFTFPEFKERFFLEKTLQVIMDKTTINYLVKITCENYLAEGRFPMSVKIKDSVKSILIFAKKDNLPMRAITPSFCRKYEDYMYKKSATKTRNGAGINLRHIRILFNRGIEWGFIPREWYPFKRKPGEKSEFKDAYVIPNERKVKEFLKDEDIIKFFETKAFNTDMQRKAHWAWLVSFLCNGCNAADFLRFKFRDIKGDYIIFYREKTKNANRSDQKPVKIYLGEELRQLINEVGNPPLPNNYIFPIYTNKMTEEEMYEARRKFTTDVSRSLKYLAKNVGILKNVRFGNARHSLAQQLKKNGVNRETIKDLFGHHSIHTIDNYFELFADEEHENLATNVMSISAIKKRLKE